MRFAIAVAVLLAVVSTALVAVCQHSETRRLQHRVWELERRRMRLEREAERLEFAIQADRTPRRLLEEHDLREASVAPETLPSPAPRSPAPATPPPTPDAAEMPRVPAGFVTGGNFEGEGR